MKTKTPPLGEEGKTHRGFPTIKFNDAYSRPCSLQESSAIPVEANDGSVANPLGWLWLGIDDANPQIMKSQALRHGLKLTPGEEVSGWMPYPIHEDVSLTTRMHLNEAQVRGLIERLQTWLKTGTISSK